MDIKLLKLTRLRKSINKNDKQTMLKLLKHGCQITFPSGYSFKGCLKTQYIELTYTIDDSNVYDDGLVFLNEEGLSEALKWKKQWEEDQKMK